jgi:hypothetical protein
VNASLWALVFGSGGTGDTNTLYFTAGLANEGHGLFGAITATAVPTADYSLRADPQATTVAAGGSANFTLTITPANGFNSLVTLRCAAPTGVTCAFNPATVTPGAGAATSMLTATTSPPVQRYGRLKVMGPLFAGVGLFGCFLVGVGKSRWGLYSLLLTGIASTLIAGSLLASTACGGGTQANRGSASIVVTATSGALSHSTTINLTVQ